MPDLSVLRRWSEAHPDAPVIVWTSGGKDSFCCLKLAVDALGVDRVHPVYRYFVDGLRCVEAPIRAQLVKLGIPHPLVKVPGADTLEMMRTGVYTKHQAIGARKVKYADIERLARKRTGALWCVSGEKQNDSSMRRLWLRTRAPDGVDDKTHRIYPLHGWTQAEARSMCTLYRVPVAPNFGSTITSGLSLNVLDEVRRRYPRDYDRIVQAFPFAEALRQRDQLYGKRPRSIAQKRKQDAERST